MTNKRCENKWHRRRSISILIAFILSVILLGSVTYAFAIDVVLEWDPSPSGNVVGYKIYTGIESGVYGDPIISDSIRTSYTLPGLPAAKCYFAVKAINQAGLESDFSNEITLDLSPTEFVLPRFALAQPQAGPGDELSTGIAISNMGSTPATLTFTAFDNGGKLITGEGLQNPSVLPPPLNPLNPATQLVRLDSEIFGDSIVQSNSGGWIKLQSTTPGVVGFYLMFDPRLSLMDGGNWVTESFSDFIFTNIASDGNTKISVVNNNPDGADVSFELIAANGTPQVPAVTLKASKYGAITADLFSDIFTGITPDPTDYVRVTSSKYVKAFQLLQQGTGSIAIIEGQQVYRGRTTLYSPQYVSNDVYRTALSIINLDSAGGLVQIRLIGDDGNPLGIPKRLAISGNGKLYIDAPDFFEAGTSVSGYVEIIGEGLGLKLTGSVVFGDATGQNFSAALPLVSKLQDSMVFSHFASDDVYFTGVAIVNPNPNPAQVTIDVHAIDGKLIQSIPETLEPGQRDCRLLNQISSVLAQSSQAYGYLKIKSDLPIAAFALFGTHGLSVLSAIPGQKIP